MGTIDKKEAFESQLTSWINADNIRMARYGKLLPEYKELYAKLKEYSLVNSYTNDVFFNNGAELVGFARNIKALAELVKNKADNDQINVMKINLMETARSFYQNYNQATDKKLFIAVMSLYGENLDLKWQAPEYVKLKKSCKGDFSSIVDKLYLKSVFHEENKFKSFVSGFNSGSISRLSKDPFLPSCHECDRFPCC